MDCRIKVLDHNTANQIAAGEVVERPASIVKELIENSVDAGSTKISVVVEKGGSTFIRVEDNGCGMNEAEVRLAIHRHATSKIKSIEDLESIDTLGFRGEALPSIAAVSRFTIFSRQHGAQLGTKLVIADKMEEVEVSGGPEGTIITVQDLFYNTPARLKFMKTPATEGGHIADIVGKMALAYPNISFSLISGGKTILCTSGNGNVSDAIGEIYGHQLQQDLLEVGFNEYNIDISGFIAKPSQVKSSRNYQTLIINGRIVRSKVISRALEEAFRSLLPGHGYPFAVLQLSLAGAFIDVNVHPTKSEIKFSQDKDVYLCVHHAVKQTLSTHPLISGNENSYHEMGGQPSLVHEQMEINMEQTAAHTDVFHLAPVAWPIRDTSAVYNQKNSGGFSVSIENKPHEPAFNRYISKQDTEVFPALEPLGQVQGTYIVARGEEGLYIIDQHAAHERIIYDTLQNRPSFQASQALLIPVHIDVSPSEAQILRDTLSLLAEVGFDVNEFGLRSFRITAVPAEIPAEDVEIIFKEILASLTELPVKNAYSATRDRMFMTIACKAAIKANKSLSFLEISALIRQLATTTAPFTCPHGRPTVILVSPQEMAKRFKRI